MSKTVTTTNIPHNDSPAIGRVEFRDSAIGKIIVSDQESREIAASGTYNVRISVGRDLLEINMSASPDQYIKIKELVDQTRKDQNANNLLHKLAFLSADEAIASECKLGANKNLLKKIVGDCLPSTVKGVLAWSPLEIWDAVPSEDLHLCSGALVLRLEDLIFEICEGYHELSNNEEFFAVVDPVKNNYLFKIAQLCMSDESSNQWPRSAFSSLLILASSQHVLDSAYYQPIVRTAVKCLTGDSDVNQESICKLVEAVYKIEGCGAVFRAVNYDELYFLEQAVALVLDLEEGSSLVSCLAEIPEEWIQELAENCNSLLDECFDHWDTLSDAHKAEITERIEQTPSILLASWNDRLPREIVTSVSKDCTIDKLVSKESGLRYVASSLEIFRSLSKKVCEKLVDSGHVEAVASNLSAFRLSDHDKAELVVELLRKGYVHQIVEQLPSLSDNLLRKVDEAGHSFLSFKHDCRSPTAELYQRYNTARLEKGPLEAKQVLLKASAMLDSIIGYGPALPEYKDDPIFQELCDFAYPQHVTKGKVAHCKDRSEDLELFEVPDKPAPLQLGGAVRLALRKNIKADNSVVSRVENLVRAPLKVSHDRDSAKKNAKQQLEQLCGLEGATDSHSLVVKTLQLVPDEQLTPARVKRALVAYHASEHADFKQYAADSVDRAEQAPNRDYAYLLELRDFLTTAVTDSLIAAIDRNPSDDPSLRAKLVHTVHNIFSEEVDAIDKELSKYVALDERGKRTREISALFIKNQPSAAMRRVAGVCVAVDNPFSENKPNKNMWEMENYLQLVLRDEQTRRCVGGVLLHYYEEQGKRILTASLNPCSTLLYKVDEETMFSELLRVLGEFADKNDIDIIGVSVSRGIRTNRTGGLFEQALNRRIREINQKFHLVKEQPFSYRLKYKQQVLDIIWRKEDEQ